MLKVHHLPGLCGGPGDGMVGMMACVGVCAENCRGHSCGRRREAGAAEGGALPVRLRGAGGRGVRGWTREGLGSHWTKERTRMEKHEACWRSMYLKTLVLFGGGIQVDIAPLG